MTKKRGKRKFRRFRIEILIFCIFVFSAVFYVGVKIGLSSYNLTLSKEEQTLTNEINSKKSEIEELETEVRSMQDKKRMLGLSSISIQDNQDNIYIMGNGEEE